jgi:hypothetical protein
MSAYQSDPASATAHLAYWPVSVPDLVALALVVLVATLALTEYLR